jgi:recombination protein RecA
VTDERVRALDLAIGQIEKQFGRGAIMRLGDASARMAVEVIPTGSISLDIALGVGGIPRGRVIEIFGPESTGKSTLAQHIVAEAQRMGGMAAYVDVEHALDPAFAQAIGINIEDLLISQPDTGEQALEITEALVRSNAVDVIVVDSVAALVPRAEIEGEMGDSHVGLQARLMSQALRKLTGAISLLGCVHQPVTREGRHHVRKPRGDAGRPRAQVLQLGANRPTAHGITQAGNNDRRQPRQGENRQEQGRAAVSGC